MEIYTNKLKEIEKRWQELRSSKENSKIRIRDAAEILGYSEAELLSTKISDSVIFLIINQIDYFLNDIKKLRKVMILSRNNIAVHEKIIETNTMIISKNHDSINISAHNFELDLDKTFYKYAFGQISDHGNSKLHSFQFFDQFGNAVLKIYLKSDLFDIYNNIITKYESPYNYELQHDNNDLMKSELSIVKNFDLFLTRFTKIKFNEKDLLRAVLEECSSEGIVCSIILFGPASIQKYNGKINKIVDYHGWLNILDTSFNLHIQDKKLSDRALLYKNNTKGNSFYFSFFDGSDNLVLSVTTCTKLKIFNKALINHHD